MTKETLFNDIINGMRLFILEASGFEDTDYCTSVIVYDNEILHRGKLANELVNEYDFEEVVDKQFLLDLLENLLDDDKYVLLTYGKTASLDPDRNRIVFSKLD